MDNSRKLLPCETHPLNGTVLEIDIVVSCSRREWNFKENNRNIQQIWRTELPVAVHCWSTFWEIIIHLCIRIIYKHELVFSWTKPIENSLSSINKSIIHVAWSMCAFLLIFVCPNTNIHISFNQRTVTVFKKNTQKLNNNRFCSISKATWIENWNLNGNLKRTIAVDS